ncbi:MAG: LuxR C-terminal-related transcriptional regulator [Candidatus Sulfotelmatobacter sp.]|jgi:DNA-binding NarL/FixJ family response regulator
MSAQLLAQALAQDPKFHVTFVSSGDHMISAGNDADVAVISLDLGGSIDETMRIARSFTERNSVTRLVMLLDDPTRDIVVDAFRCGASGVFSRTQPVSEFLKCVDRVSQGEIWASKSEIDYLLSALRGTPGSRMVGCEAVRVLTRRELEVVRQAGEGLSNREIAEKLGLSEHTVKNYLFRAFEKIGVSSRVELLFHFLRHEKLLGDKQAVEQSEESDDPLSKCREAAQEGSIVAQFALGLAYLHGEEAEKDDYSAYYWLSLAEQNAERVIAQSRHAVKQLRKSMNAVKIKEIDRTLAAKSGHTRSKPVLNSLKHRHVAVPSSLAV